MNCFRVNNISVIKHWGDLKLLPEILTVNLTRETAWSLGTEIELPLVKKDNSMTKINDPEPDVRRKLNPFQGSNFL